MKFWVNVETKPTVALLDSYVFNKLMAKNLKYQLGFAPILLLLLILLGGVLVASYFLIFANTVKTVFVTDNNPEGTGVVWQTSAPSVSYLVADQGLLKTQLSVFNPASQKITDIVEGNGRTHYAKLKNLSANTTYALKIVVNGVVKDRVLITTAPKLADVPTPMPLMGEVLDQNSQYLQNSVMMVQLVSKTQTSKSSIILASKLSSEGKFAIDLSNIRTADLKNSFNYDSQNDQIQLTLLSDKGLATLLMSLEEAFSKQKFQFVFAQASAPLDKLIGIVYAGHFKESGQTPTNFCEDGKVTGEDGNGDHYFIRNCTGDYKCENGECVYIDTGDLSTDCREVARDLGDGRAQNYTVCSDGRETPNGEPYTISPPQPKVEPVPQAPVQPVQPVAPLPINTQVDAASAERLGSTFPLNEPTQPIPQAAPPSEPQPIAPTSSQVPASSAGISLASSQPLQLQPLAVVKPQSPPPTIVDEVKQAVGDVIEVPLVKEVATTVVNLASLPGKTLEGIKQITAVFGNDFLIYKIEDSKLRSIFKGRSFKGNRSTLASVSSSRILGVSTIASEKGQLSATELQNGNLAITAPDGELTLIADVGDKKVTIAKGRVQAGKFYQVEPKLEGREGEIKLKGGQIQLDSGWNLVALNVTPKKDYTAEDILNEINAEGGEAVAVNRWIDNKWQTHVAGNFGTNFKIEVGHGYFVYAKKASTWLVPAQNDIVKPDVLVDPGWNLLATTNLSINRASELLSHINTNSTPAVNADTVTQYVNNLWQSIKVKDNTVFGKDFEVTNRRSYFIKAQNQGVWKSQ